MPRIRAVRVVLCFAPLLLAATTAWPHPAQKPAVVLTGTIFSDGDNQRIARASIALCDDGGVGLQQSPADDGEVSFHGLQPGHFILKVQASGCYSVGMRIALHCT